MKKVLLILISAIIILAPAAIFAEEKYELLAPLGNLKSVAFGPTSDLGQAPAKGLATYLSWIFKFTLAAAGILAVTQIVIAGIQMIASTASEKTRGDAKDRINDAVWGLILALGSYLILNTINPDLVKFDFGLEAIKVTVQDAQESFPNFGDGPNYSANSEESGQTLLNSMRKGNIFVDNVYSCGAGSSPQQILVDTANGDPISVCSSGCSQGGECEKRPDITINPVMLDSTMVISASVGKLRIVSLTGGNHAVNSDHYTGNAIDVVPISKDPAVWNEIIQSYENSGADKGQTSCDINGVFESDCRNVFNNGVPKRGAHIHVKFNR